MSERSPAEAEVAAELTRLLREGGKWRTGALLLSYKRETDGPRECHIANAVMMESKEHALDMAYLIGRLRSLADELEQTFRGERPLPEQPKEGG